VIRKFGAALCVLVMAGCSDSGPTSATPPTAAFVGTWIEAPGSSSRLQITLSNAPSQTTLAGGPDTMSGSWTIVADDGSRTLSSGTCGGRVSGGMITMLLRVVPPIPGACDESLSGTLDASGTRMSGNRGVSCQGSIASGAGGTITLIKQQ
jgi:hypothetical protein